MKNLTELANNTFSLDRVEKGWKWHLIMGFLFIGAGVIGLLAIPLATLSSVILFASFMTAGGILQIVEALKADESRRSRTLHLIGGALYVMGGSLMIWDPVAASLALTFILAVIIFAGGMLRIVLAYEHRKEMADWVIVLAGGIASICLAILIGVSWPYSALWSLGLFISLDLIFNGWTQILVAFALGRKQMSGSGAVPAESPSA